MAPSLPQGKIGGCQSKHPAEGSGQMRSIGKAGAMSSGGDAGAINQVTLALHKPLTRADDRG